MTPIDSVIDKRLQLGLIARSRRVVKVEAFRPADVVLKDYLEYAGVDTLADGLVGREREPKPVCGGLKRQFGIVQDQVAAYFGHNSYVAHVLDLVIENNRPVVRRVCSAVDCGIVVNPDAATNMVEGAIVDGVGNALFGRMTFTDGVPDKQNFNSYRMIRNSEAPKAIDVHFVKSDVDPTGLGEPPFPPIFAALANALHKVTGKRYSDQPFLQGESTLG